MRTAVVLVAVAACGRVGFEPSDAGPSDGPADGNATSTRCAVPPRPDVSSPRVVLGCDSIVATSELVNGGVVRIDCPSGMTVMAQIPIRTDAIIDARGTVFTASNNRVFLVQAGGHLTLLDATITQGTALDEGAGIRVEQGGSLVVYGSHFIDNHGPAMSPTAGGGAISGLPTDATVTVYDSTFSNNTSASGGAIQVYSDLTVVDSTFDNNAATGSSGNGGGGGAILSAGTGKLTLCGDSFSSNAAGALGGAVMHVSNDSSAIDRFDDVAMDFNRAAGGGGAYVQTIQSLTLRGVSATSNVTDGAGAGLWLQSSTVDAENLSIVFNRSDNGVGGGIFASGGTSGRVAFSTISENAVVCAGCTAGAFAGAGTIDLSGTVISDNTAPVVPRACTETGTASGASFQWPGDLPLCANGATVTDPFLQPHAMASGPAGTYLVRKPAAGSPVIRAATGCPADDILGNPRPSPCAAGAVEP